MRSGERAPRDFTVIRALASGVCDGVLKRHRRDGPGSILQRVAKTPSNQPGISEIFRNDNARSTIKQYDEDDDRSLRAREYGDGPPPRRDPQRSHDSRSMSGNIDVTSASDRDVCKIY